MRKRAQAVTTKSVSKTHVETAVYTCRLTIPIPKGVRVLDMRRYTPDGRAPSIEISATALEPGVAHQRVSDFIKTINFELE
jgi:hypothetical protein